MTEMAREIREGILELRKNNVGEDDVTITMTLKALMELVDPDKKWMNDWEWDEKEERFFCPNCRLYLLPKAPLTNYCPDCGSYMRETWRRDMRMWGDKRSGQWD